MVTLRVFDVALGVLLLAGTSACTGLLGINNEYVLETDAGPDAADSATPQDAAGNDGSACSGRQCTGPASDCSDKCQGTYDTCKTQFCDGGSCAMCSSARDTCRSSCVTTCTSCEQTAGCVDTGQCSNAVNNN
jgi:hypothetical protein